MQQPTVKGELVKFCPCFRRVTARKKGKLIAARAPGCCVFVITLAEHSIPPFFEQDLFCFVQISMLLAIRFEHSWELGEHLRLSQRKFAQTLSLLLPELSQHLSISIGVI